MKRAKTSKKRTLVGILHYLKPHAFPLVCVVLFAAAQVALTLAIPVLAGKGIDCMVGAGDVAFEKLYTLLLAIGGCAAGSAICQWVMNLLSQRIAYQMLACVREDAFRNLQALPLKYLDNHPSGGVASVVISDAEQFADGLLLGFTQLFTGITTILGLLVILFIMRWEIALVVLCVTPLSLLSAKFISSRTYQFFKAQAKARETQTAFIDEAVGNVKLVKAFCREQESEKNFQALNDDLAKCGLKAVYLSSVTNPTTRFINSIVYALVALTGAFLVISTGGIFTVGNFSSALSYCTQYTKPFNEITDVIAEFQNALACAARLLALIDEAPEVSDADSETLEAVRGEIQLENVAFSYTPEQKLIENLNVSVPAGKRVAIVGPTGCGKTTIINLLMRFYDVNDGSIKVDGKDVRDITRKSLRDHFGMVLQDTWLKTATVRENLCMGQKNTTEEEMIEACKAVHAHNFIMQLPEGYDTVLSEDGNLSQGQKQLLCIARVMLSHPRMLILDEATSSIDTRTELKVQDAFEKLMEGRTSFIVAHRLSTIQTADLILVMNAGNIVEQGTHGELLERKGFYYDLYNAQFAQ